MRMRILCSANARSCWLEMRLRADWTLAPIQTYHVAVGGSQGRGREGGREGGMREGGGRIVRNKRPLPVANKVSSNKS